MSGKEQDIRWEQRFSNYSKALAQLQKYMDKENFSGLEQQGLIEELLSDKREDRTSR